MILIASGWTRLRLEESAPIARFGFKNQAATKVMEIGSSHSGLTYHDVPENCSETVQVQEDGTAGIPSGRTLRQRLVAQDTEGQ